MAVQNQNDAHMAVHKSCIQGTLEVLTVNWLRSQHTPFKPSLLCCSIHMCHKMQVCKQPAVQLQCAVISHPKFLQINIELQVCTSMCSQNKPGVSYHELRPSFGHSMLGTKLNLGKSKIFYVTSILNA
jgi:hypothetical protein